MSGEAEHRRKVSPATASAGMNHAPGDDTRHAQTNRARAALCHNGRPAAWARLTSLWHAVRYSGKMTPAPLPVVRALDPPVAQAPASFQSYGDALTDARRRFRFRDDQANPEFRAWNSSSDYDPALREHLIAAFRDYETNLVAVYVDWNFAYLADHGPDDLGTPDAPTFWPDYAIAAMPWTTRDLEARGADSLIREIGDGLVLTSVKRLRPTAAELQAEIEQLQAEREALLAAGTAEAPDTASPGGTD